MGKNKYFQKIAQSPEREVRLAEAALRIAADEYPRLRVKSYLGLLDEWSETLRSRFGAKPAHVQLERLNEWLFETMRFSGNEEDYYDPKNSFLNDVIDRRIGIPITLSVIYLEMAWALGLEAAGISFPGHFLVRVITEGKPLYVDTFHKGKLMTADGCMQFLRELTEGELDFQDSFLLTVSKRDILTRMLRNLKRIYLEAYNFPKLIRVIDKLVALAPGIAEEIRDRGIIHYQMKSFQLAREDFETFLSLSTDPEDTEVIRQYLEILREYRTHVN
jgi:regulator of sirC expression with transglutaminase-like and TPR domain